VLTGEDIEKKQASAIARKLDFDNKRQSLAKEHVALVKSRAAARHQREKADKADKENLDHLQDPAGAAPATAL
jgi:hypothetical protein